MLQIHEVQYVAQLLNSLNEFISEGSFAWRSIDKIGRELYGYLLEDEEAGFSYYFPVEALTDYLSNGWRLDDEWLAEEDGTFLDDSGLPVPGHIPTVLSPLEHLAAFGIWMVKNELGALGPLNQEFDPLGLSADGLAKTEILLHRNSCVVLGYQALVAALNLFRKTQDQIEETALTLNSRKAANARHAETRRLENEAFEYWKHNIDPEVSNDEAATILVKQIPLKLRTLSSYVSKFKKASYMHTVQLAGARTAS